jgi:hypothetical protein
MLKGVQSRFLRWVSDCSPSHIGVRAFPPFRQRPTDEDLSVGAPKKGERMGHGEGAEAGGESPTLLLPV